MIIVWTFDTAIVIVFLDVFFLFTPTRGEFIRTYTNKLETMTKLRTQYMIYYSTLKSLFVFEFALSL